MRRLHIVPEINEANGVYQVARDLAREDGGRVIHCSECSSAAMLAGKYDEVWLHGMWLPGEWRACWLALRAGQRLVRMTHGSLSPIYLERQGKWKKRLVGPIERWLLRRVTKIVVTCKAEAEWVRRYLGPVAGSGSGENGAKIEITDLKRFFKLGGGEGLGRRSRSTAEGALHVLYLGRRHPLKGVERLERAVEEVRGAAREGTSSTVGVELRVVSDHFGEELEKDWAWCDVLVLPTLSENFGRVVAEALERGKRVITTDGAPAWEPPEATIQAKGEDEQWRNRLVYLRGFRDGTDEERVKLLKQAILEICD